MKKLTLTVLTIISLASCTKEYVAPQDGHAKTETEVFKQPYIYEGNWLMNYDNDSIIHNAVYTRTTMKNDSIVFNYRLTKNGYILDTNGVDTYRQNFLILTKNKMQWYQENLIDSTTRTLYFVK
jgi:hypothetical protein